MDGLIDSMVGYKTRARMANGNGGLAGEAQQIHHQVGKLSYKKGHAALWRVWACICRTTAGWLDGWLVPCKHACMHAGRQAGLVSLRSPHPPR
jgi:hypothetical protein